MEEAMQPSSSSLRPRGESFFDLLYMSFGLTVAQLTNNFPSAPIKRFVFLAAKIARSPNQSTPTVK